MLPFMITNFSESKIKKVFAFFHSLPYNNGYNKNSRKQVVCEYDHCRSETRAACTGI